jgi:hypothetical protein
MESAEFYDYFNFFPNLQKHFDGVFSIDTIPKSIKFRHFCIVNTDFHNGIGKHWFIIIKNDKHNIEIFDSLGIDSEKEELLKKYCKLRVKNLIVNETSFQENDTNTCGKFCLFFSINRWFKLNYTLLLKNNDSGSEGRIS